MLELERPAVADDAVRADDLVSSSSPNMTFRRGPPMSSPLAGVTPSSCWTGVTVTGGGSSRRRVPVVSFPPHTVVFGAVGILGRGLPSAWRRTTNSSLNGESEAGGGREGEESVWSGMK